MNLNIYGPEKAVLTHQSKNYSLTRTSKASGVAYKGKHALVWNKGLEYLIEIDDTNRVCHPQPQLLDTAELSF